MSEELALADVARIVAAFFDAVSFDDGVPPYDRIRDLFIDDGKLINTRAGAPQISTVDQFIAPRRAAVESGALTSFREIETTAST